MRPSKVSNTFFAFLLVLILLPGLKGGSALAAPPEPTPGAAPQPHLQATLQPQQQATLQAQLRAKVQSLAAGGTVRYGEDPRTGRVNFIGTDPGHPILLAQPSTRSGSLLYLSPQDSAQQFLNGYGALFGLRDPARELSTEQVQDGANGRTFVRYQQVYQGVPVFGGEMVIQAASEAIYSANGKVAQDLSLDVTPQVSADTARRTALEMTAKIHALDISRLKVTQPELWVYDPNLLSAPVTFPAPRLAWRMEVSAVDLSPVRELVLVDAKLGMVALHFNQIDTAKNRAIFDNNNNFSLGLPGGVGSLPARTEGQTAIGQTEVDKAYAAAGATYDFYFNRFNRDSIDGAGMQLINTVRYCPVSSCSAASPYLNAFWNGSQMVYGDGFASADDVVAHEMTHGVTERTSKLLYFYQAGAINEALSDIFGEFIDQTDGLGNDSTAVEWMMGEDLPASIGVIRNMQNPTIYGDPDKMSSPNYWCSSADYGGVHSNSGIANKAAYLMVDGTAKEPGGTFNGQGITGIGLEKAAKIWYEAETHLITAATDYNDLYHILPQACSNLVGTPGGPDAGNCQQVQKVVTAVEMNLQPASCVTPPPPLCAADQIPAMLLNDNLENPVPGRWTSDAVTGTINKWFYPQNPNSYQWDMTYTTSGKINFWGYDYGNIGDYALSLATPLALPAGKNLYLYFNHAYQFDYDFSVYYDGGVLEYSLNNGSTWIDAGPLITNNGYSHPLDASFGNPIGGKLAFSGNSSFPGYNSTRVNLTSLAGNPSFRFRFRIGTDNGIDSMGWWIDDIRLYSCETITSRVYLPLTLP